MLSQAPSRSSSSRFRVVTQAILSALALLMTLSVGSPPAGAQTLPNDPQPGAGNDCGVSTTMFNGFFTSHTAAVDGVVDPANSITFPNNTGLHNCDFYQWAQQMFLWLTSPAPASYGGGGGRIFASPQFFTVSPADSTGKRTLISNQSMFSILGLGKLGFLGIRAAQVGPHGLPVIMSKSRQMFEVQPGPISQAGKPLVLNKAGKQVEVSETAMRAGKLVLLDTRGKAINTPKLIVPKQIPQEQIQRLRPQQQLLPELAPEHEVMMKLAPQHEVLLKTTAENLKVLQKLQPAPVNSKLIAQRFMVNGRPIFLNINGGVIDTEEGQAITNGVLLAQNGSLIYYITMVNDVMAYFLTGTKKTLLGQPGGISPAPTQFPKSASDFAKITTFATAHISTSTPVTDPTCAAAIGAATSPFPDPCALAIEVKSAWIETTGLANPDQYITTQAVVPVFDKTDPTHWKGTTQTKTTTLALVGMHVVGSANGHSEMIWATFEHFGNAPNAEFEYASTTGPKKLNNPPTPVTGTWTFCCTNANGPFNQPRQTFVSPDIVGVSGGNIGPSDVMRSSAFGANFGVQPNPLIATDNVSNSQLIGIDNSIQSDFAALAGGPDIRTNYYMTGATWTENGNPPNTSFPAGINVGTSVLAGSTMETFQQPSNCFGCHLTNQLNVSHVTCQAGTNSTNQCLNGIQPLF